MDIGIELERTHSLQGFHAADSSDDIVLESKKGSKQQQRPYVRDQTFLINTVSGEDVEVTI